MENTRSIPLHVRVSPHTQWRLTALATAERRPVASLIAILIDDALDARDPEPVSERPPPRPSPSSLSHSRVVSAVVGDEIRAAADQANASYSAPSAAAAPRIVPYVPAEVAIHAVSRDRPARPDPAADGSRVKPQTKADQIRALRESR